MANDKIKIGERLIQLRDHYSQQSGKRKKQRDVALDLGWSPSKLERIENGRGGTLDDFHKLYDYYHQLGYNIHWLIADDNSSLSMYRPAQTEASVELDRLMLQLEKFKRDMGELIAHKVETFQAGISLNAKT